MNPDIYYLVVPPGEQRELRFVSGERFLSWRVVLGQQIDFDILFAGVRYPTRIGGVPPMAKFDEAYQAAHRGRIEVSVPEVYELVNIAIALTPTARANKTLIARESPYYEAVMSWFLPYAGHPLVAALDGELGKGRYFELKMNAFAFEFAADDRLLRSRVYDRCGFPGSPQNALLPLLDSLQAFANHSRFREFFGIHRPFYQSQESYLSSALDAPAMLTWLRSRFPTAVPFDGYRIVFSPLVGGRQSVTWLESNGYRELQAHVNFPYPVESDGALSPAASSFRRGQIVFTELNHGFINPAADPFRPQIAAVFSDREFWVVKGSSADSYGNVYLDAAFHF